jgi:hypothetical protein
MKLKIELFFFFRAQAVKRKLEAQREEKRRQNISHRPTGEVESNWSSGLCYEWKVI